MKIWNPMTSLNHSGLKIVIWNPRTSLNHSGLKIVIW